MSAACDAAVAIVILQVIALFLWLCLEHDKHMDWGDSEWINPNDSEDWP